MLANRTCIAFTDILKNANKDLTLKYFERIVENLQKVSAPHDEVLIDILSSLGIYGLLEH